MYKVKITVIRKANYTDLQEKYENPIEHPCEMREGQIWISDGWNKPQGICNNAWECIMNYVRTLGLGGEDFFDGWMKNPKSALISCNDGFRPVSYLIERID